MKTVIRALLAASMLMPIAAQAQAQDRDGRDRNDNRRGEWNQRGPRRTPGDVGPQPRAQAEMPRAEAPRAEAPRFDGRRGEGMARPDDRGPRTDDRRGDDRRDDVRPPVQRDVERGGDWRREPRDVRQGYDPRAGVPQQRDWRGDRQQRGWDGRNGNDDRRWDGRNPGGDRADGRRFDDRGGAWNRGWRNDSRYDWNRYRMTNRSAYRLPRYYAPSGWGYGYRRFSVGVSLSSILFNRNYWIEDPYSYRLPEAYGPYRWVRYYDDALLVDLRSGVVVDTVYDIFG